MVWRIGGASVKRVFRLAKFAWKIHIQCFVTSSLSTNRSFYSLKNNASSLCYIYIYIIYIYIVANRDMIVYFLRLEKGIKNTILWNSLYILYFIYSRVYSNLCSSDKKRNGICYIYITFRMIRGSLPPLMDRYKINFVSGEWHLLQQ